MPHLPLSRTHLNAREPHVDSDVREVEEALTHARTGTCITEPNQIVCDYASKLFFTNTNACILQSISSARQCVPLKPE